MMNLFASDLDRTLIYSKRALQSFSQDNLSDLVPVERKDESDVAFMTGRSFAMLKELAASLMFVPVTTRTYEQYKRIFIFSEDIQINYAVTANGANIHYKGQELLEWKEVLKRRLGQDCTLYQDMIENVSRLSIQGNLKKAENLFFYYILDTVTDQMNLEEISRFALEHGWRISLQGKKLYFMPNPICKGEALQFIKEREMVDRMIGAGDSILDYDFLRYCQEAFVPNHGELMQRPEIKKIVCKITQNKGVWAGEEILDSVNKTVNIPI
ncbi:HAD family hydrolase [Cytobacillus gottheilii]|uniref:HAD family hydrolase n=1 Tax=Cytobacillus gottheilii TaxID=859144 RepID=UPI002147DD45|nr:HAD family hydrolase [Cytobacillus gottheilii]